MKQTTEYATKRRVGCVMWLAILAIVMSGLSLMMDTIQELAWNQRVEQATDNLSSSVDANAAQQANSAPTVASTAQILTTTQTPTPENTHAPAAVPTPALVLSPTTAPTAILLAVPTASWGRWTAWDGIKTLSAAGLEVESAYTMAPNDFGLAPLVATSAVRFLIPSLCEDCGGRVMAFATPEDQERMRTYYDEFGRQSAALYSHVFVVSNLLLQINGDLPEDRAQEYLRALRMLGD